MASTSLQFGLLIAHFTRLVNKFKALDKLGRDFGTGEILHAPEIHAIEALGKGWCRTAGELAEHFAVTKGAISQVLGKLEKRGYLLRRRNPEFPKEKLLALTARGQTAFQGHEAFHQAMDAGLAAGLDGLGMEEAAKLEDLLSLMERHIEAYLEKTSP